MCNEALYECLSLKALLPPSRPAEITACCAALRSGQGSWGKRHQIPLCKILDTESTGMNPGADEVIELGMLKLEYGQDGQYSVLDSFDRLQQPKKPIPAHITAITGITDEE